MRRTIAVTLVLTILLALTAASFHFNGPQFNWPVGSDYKKPVPVTVSSGGLISIDYLKNATRDPGPGQLSSNWYDFNARGQSGGTGPAGFLGFNYTPDITVTAIPEDLYYTGESHYGKRIYVSPDDPRKSRVPDVIYLADGGNYTRYSIADKPPIYAYTLCGAYNTNETVAFGVANDAGGPFQLMNAAPYEIQRKGDSGWVTVFSPMAAQVIVPMDNGTFREWHWDQKTDDGTLAPFGDYRVVIADDFITTFRISGDTPAVMQSDAVFSSAGAEEAFSSPPQASPIEIAYKPAPYSAELRGDLISEMLFKSWARKTDPGQLKAAINATGMQDNAEMLPCLAVRAKYEGKPAWIITFVYGGEDVVLSRIRYFVVGDDAKVVARGPIGV